jgi:hypothetical protein
MKTILLATTTLFLAFATGAGATSLIQSEQLLAKAPAAPLMQLAEKGSSDNSGSGSSGSGSSGSSGSGSSGDSDDNDSGDDNGGDDDSSDDDGDDDASGSGRSKPRVPGGSGCDSAEDIAEHPECKPAQ